MTLILFKDFEEGIPGEVIGAGDGIDAVTGSPILYTTDSMHGGLAAHCQAIASSPTMRFDLPVSTFAVSVYTKIHSTTGGSATVMDVRSGTDTSTSIAKVRFHPNGNIDIANENNLRQVFISDMDNWEVGQWFRFDVNVVYSDGSSSVNLKVYRPAESTAPLGELNYTVQKPPAEYLYIGTGNASWSLIHDSIRIYDTVTEIEPIDPEEGTPPDPDPEEPVDEYVDGVARHDFEEGSDGQPITVGTRGVVGVSAPAPAYTSSDPISGSMSLSIPPITPGPYVEYDVPNDSDFSVSVTCRVDTPGTTSAANFLVLEEVGGLELVRIRLHQSGVIDVADRNNLRVLNPGIQWPSTFRIDARYQIVNQSVTLSARVYDLTGGEELSIGEFQTVVSISDFGEPPAPGIPSRLRIGTSNAAWGITIDEVVRFQVPEWTGEVPSGEVLHHWVGATLHNSFMVKSKVVVAQNVGLRYSLNQDMTNSVEMEAQLVDSAGYVTFDITGLDPAQTYYYQLYDSSGPIGPVGRAHTLATPGDPATIKVVLGACTLKNHQDGSAHSAIRDWNPDFMVHTGDFYYTSSQSPDPAVFEGLYEDMIQTYPSHDELCRDVPMWYIPSDHEAGQDNADSNNEWTRAHIDAYMHIVPNRVADTRFPVRARYQSWVSGRVRFIMTDVRTLDRSPGLSTDDANKTMLGEVQKQWLKDELSKPEPLKIIITDPGWMGPPTTSQGEDKWWSYATERQEIIDYITANNIQVEVWHGDSHSIAVKGKDNPYGGFAVLCSAPLAQTGGGRMLGEFDQYWNNPSAPTRSWMRITISDDGNTITRVAEGVDATTGIVRVSSTETYSASEPSPPPVFSVWTGQHLEEVTDISLWNGDELIGSSETFVWDGSQMVPLDD